MRGLFWKGIGWVLARLELFMLRFLVRTVASGVYYLKYATEEDLIKLMRVEMDWDEFDGLIYRREIEGIFYGKLIRVYVWSSHPCIWRVWVRW